MLRIGLTLTASDPAVKLGIWPSLQDFGEPLQRTYGLYREGEFTAANRKPAYHHLKQ